MPIQIQFGLSEVGPILVEANAQGLLTLPQLRVRAGDGAQPVLLHRVSVRVSGDPTGVATLSPAYGGYPEPLRTYDPPADLLGGDRVIQPADLHLEDKELPPGLYTLRAEVDFQRGPAYEGGKAGPRTTLGFERQLEVPVDLPRPVRIIPVWKHREVIIDRNPPAELEIGVDRLPRGGSIEVSVLDPTLQYVPELRTLVESILRQKPPVRDGEANPSGRTTFNLRIDIKNLDIVTREAIGKWLPMSLDLLVRARLETRPLTDTRPAEYQELCSRPLRGDDHALMVDSNENVFDGFPVLDLGTSSMFAVIFYRGKSKAFLPVEQEQTYRSKLMQFLSETDGVFGTAAWKSILAGAAAALVSAAGASAPPAQTIREYLKQNRPAKEEDSDSKMYRVLHALESQPIPYNAPDRDRLAVRRLFADLHALAFSRFPLRRQKLIPVNLDLSRPPTQRAEGEIALPISSTTEVKHAGATKGDLELDIGEQAHVNRLEAMRSNPEGMRTRFHASPKLYYDMLGQSGETVRVSSGGAVIKVQPRDFMVAALVRLRERIDAFRASTGDLPPQRFNKIVLTFPTSAKLNVRAELMKVAQEAGFDQPVADLDEALSAVVFHLVKPFGDDKEMGLEAFRTACRPVFKADASLPREWLQNVLLIDVGGGTTDIALVEAKLVDETPVTLDSALGRYYRLTPTLLGATGRGQLAGNLLTLYLFHDLKCRIADAVLSVVEKLKATAEPDQEFLTRAQAAAAGLEPPFGANGRYVAGAVREHYDSRNLWNQGGDIYSPAAYLLADRVVGTIWHEKPTELKPASRRFQELWELAETLKITMFATADQHEYVLDPPRLAAVLGVSQQLAEQVLPVTLTRSDFLAAVDPPLGSIVDLAVKLVTGQLTKADQPSDLTAGTTTHKTLDRIILTGRTCKLPRVKEKVADAFREVCDGKNQNNIRWDPAQITYEDDYAKQAAAIGASYAQVLREHRVPPDVFGELAGNQLDVNIDNLFTYLPCGFQLSNPGGDPKRLLTIGQPFDSFDDKGVGHLASAWCIKPSEIVSIERFDFEGGREDSWGSFNCLQLSTEAQMAWPLFQADVSAAIETDQRLVVSVLFCRGPVQHHAFPPTTGEWNLARKLLDKDLIYRPRPPVPPGAPAAGPAKVPPAAPVTIPSDWLASVDGWVLVVNESSPYSKVLFTLSPGMFDKTFRTPDRKEVAGTVSLDELPPCPVSGLDHFSVRPADGSGASVALGSVRRPTGPDDKPGPTRVILTARGDLLMLVGALQYATSAAATDLQQPGIVVRRPLGYPNKRPEDVTDPFCGRH